jgi:hypothetical protein
VTPPSKAKPTAREVWEGIDDTSFRAEVDRIIEMSDDEVEAELIKDGFDPAKLRAGGQSTKQGQGAPEKQATERKPAPVRRLSFVARTAPWLIAATLITLLGSVGVTSLVGRGQPDSRAQRAATLRNDAKEACAKAQWRTCLDRLDEADDLDRGGANEPSVQALRKQAEEGARRGP